MTHALVMMVVGGGVLAGRAGVALADVAPFGGCDCQASGGDVLPGALVVGAAIGGLVWVLRSSGRGRRR